MPCDSWLLRNGMPSDLTDSHWLSKVVFRGVSIDKGSIYEVWNLVIPRSII